MHFVLRLFVFVLFICAQAYAQQPVEEPFQAASRTAILIDASSGKVLFEKDADVAVPPASMSKLMLQAVVLDLLKSGDITENQTFKVSENAWRKGGAPAGGSTMYAELNSEVEVINLLRGAIIDSGNDSCIILAEGIAGSEEAFLGRMREKAKALGLKNSSFANVTGLPDPNHKMSMRDLAVLAKYIIDEHPTYFKIYAEKSFTWNKIEQKNRNPLLADFQGADGMKTGFTEAAGYSLVGTAEKDGRRLIAVIGGLTTAADRKKEAAALLNWGYSRYKQVDIFEKGEKVAEARVWGGNKDWINLVTEEEFKVRLSPSERDSAELKLSYTGPLIAPVKSGDKIGSVKVFVDGRLLREIPVLAAEGAEAEEGMWSKAWDSARIIALGE